MVEMERVRWFVIWGHSGAFRSRAGHIYDVCFDLLGTDYLRLRMMLFGQ